MSQILEVSDNHNQQILRQPVLGDDIEESFVVTGLKDLIEEWWEVSDLISKMITASLSHDVKLTRELTYSLKMEVIAIGTLSCFELESRMDPSINSYFKNLFFYLH